MRELLEEQIQLLANWNKEHINSEPEQVRKNIETLTWAIHVSKIPDGSIPLETWIAKRGQPTQVLRLQSAKYV